MDADAKVISPRRSLLFIPGDSPRKIQKGAQLEADTIIFDLEDAVAISRKSEARESVAAALGQVDFGPRERLARVNPVTTPFFTADLAAVAPARPEGIILPKVEDAEQVRQADLELVRVEQANDWPPGTIRLFALIETALGVMNVREIAQASRRLEGLMLGAEDLAADVGSIRTREGWEVFYARSAVVTAAAAYHLQAIDAVFIDLRDQAGLEKDASFARQMGFSGKMALHPGQLTTINRIFSPSSAEIAAAQRLVQSFQAHEEAGSGVFALDDQMVDMPRIRAAERLLNLAQAVKQRDK